MDMASLTRTLLARHLMVKVDSQHPDRSFQEVVGEPKQGGAHTQTIECSMQAKVGEVACVRLSEPRKFLREEKKNGERKLGTYRAGFILSTVTITFFHPIASYPLTFFLFLFVSYCLPCLVDFPARYPQPLSFFLSSFESSVSAPHSICCFPLQLSPFRHLPLQWPQPNLLPPPMHPQRSFRHHRHRHRVC